MASIFDPKTTDAAQKDYWEQWCFGKNKEAIAAFNQNASLWLEECKGKGSVQPNKPAPPTAWKVSAEGSPYLSSEALTSPVADPVFNAKPGPGFVTTVNDPYLPHFLTIEQMLREIWERLKGIE